MSATLIKRFEDPDEVRTFEKGKFEILRLGGMVIGRATYAPGAWRVSKRPSSTSGIMPSPGYNCLALMKLERPASVRPRCARTAP